MFPFVERELVGKPLHDNAVMISDVAESPGAEEKIIHSYVHIDVMVLTNLQRKERISIRKPPYTHAELPRRFGA